MSDVSSTESGDATIPLSRNRPYTALAAASTISELGDAVARAALAFGILGLPGGTAGELSLVIGPAFVPQVGLVLVGGVVADRVSRSKLMVTTDLIGLVATGGLATLLLLDQNITWLLVALALLTGTSAALFAPTSSAVVADLVPRAGLQRANAVMRISRNIASITGLAASGVLVATVGAGWALAIDAATFAVSATLVATLRLPPRIRAVAQSGFADLREGWREFWSRQWLWVVVLQSSLVVLAYGAVDGVLGPLQAIESYGGAPAWATIIAAQAAGSLAGAGLAARIRVRRPIAVAVITTLPMALPMALLGVAAPVWTVVVAAFGAGVAIDTFLVLWATTLQREIPNEVLGRVNAYDFLGSLALTPAGVAAAGPLAEATGPGPALLGSAALVIVATCAAITAPGVRSLTTVDPAVRGRTT
jgi:predicted MFS family arabinose efflux permease